MYLGPTKPYCGYFCLQKALESCPVLGKITAEVLQRPRNGGIRACMCEEVHVRNRQASRRISGRDCHRCGIGECVLVCTRPPSCILSIAGIENSFPLRNSRAPSPE